MMVMALLMTLIGAFIQVERANHRLTGNALERRAAQDGCVTALNLAWSYLEDKPNWGTTAYFPMTAALLPPVNPIARIEPKLVGSDKVLHGSIHPEGDFDGPSAVTFDLTIYNNLTGPLSRAPSKNFPVPVPTRSCRMICIARCGSSIRRMDTILRQVPISYDSLAARHKADLGANTGLVRLESRDPYINRMRAADLALPPAANVQFLKNGSADAHHLTLNGLAQTENQLDAANVASAGTYRVGQGPPTLPTFDPDNFKLPDDPTKVSNAAAGEYHFGGLDQVAYNPVPLEYQVPPITPPATPSDPNPAPIPQPNGTLERCQKATSVYDKLIDAEGRVWVSANARSNSTTFYPPVPQSAFPSEGAAASWGYDLNLASAGPQFQDPQGNQITPAAESDVHEIYPGLLANVVTGQMAVRSGYKIECNGDFNVTADGARLPEMLFGYQYSFPGGVAVQQSLNDGLEAALDDPKKYMAALVANGNINIPGGALGYGSMIAGGDMTVKASSGLRAAPQLGVVVKARNLTINPATEPEPQLPGEPVSMDYPVFKDAINTYANGDWAPFDNWLTQTGAQRASITQAMKTTPLSNSPTTYWSQLNTELNTNFPVPVWGAGWGSTTTLEQYVRMKEYVQTLAAGYNNGQGDKTWIDMNAHAADAEARLSNMVGSMAQWAKSYKKTLQAYLDNPAAQVPEMFYQGLVYADGNLIINANGKSFRLEGSALAGGDAIINGARSVDLVYDRELVDNQLNTNHTVNGNNTHLRLEKIFFTIQ